MKLEDLGVASRLGRYGAALALALGLFGAFGLTSAEAARVANKCDYAKNNDVAEVVGQVLRPATQKGPNADETNPGAMVTSCEFEGDSGRVVVSLTSFSSADQAGAALDQTLQDARDASDITTSPTQIIDEAGLGDRAYWIKTSTTSAYLVVVGNKMAAVAIAWSDIDMDTSRPALLRLTQSVLERI